MNIQNDFYNECVENMKKHSDFFHYTDIEALKKILSNKSFRLSRIDKVNDKEENKRLDCFMKNTIYLGCFSYDDQERTKLWKEYGKSTEDNGEGIRITVNSKAILESDFSVFRDAECTHELIKERRNNTDWYVNDISFADVKYVDDLKEYNSADKYLEEEYKNIKIVGPKKDFTFPINPGLIKTKIWENEKETRVRIKLSTNKISSDVVDCPYEYIYIKIPESLLKTIKITMNPYHNDDFENRIREILNQYLPDNNIKIEESKI